MLSLRFVALVFILLYFWYMTGSHQATVTAPVTQLDDKQPDRLYMFMTTQHNYQCTFNNRTWSTDMPDGYYNKNNPWEIKRKDPCFAIGDHGKVLATGTMLYEYLKNERLQSSQRDPVEIDADTVFQDRNVFYFECLHGEIFKLHQCPTGQIFKHRDCQPVSVCLNQPDGTIFPDPLDPLSYYQCVGSQLKRKQCAVDTFFEHDRCKETDVQHFCRHNAFQMLDERTLLMCRRGRATFETCPSGFRYFAKTDPLDTEPPVCESDQCVGITDGQKISLFTKKEYNLAYSPGFMTCQNDRVRDTVTCPQHWDTSLTDHQLPLPQVFDATLQACTVPQFCENVQPLDSDTIVPVREWTRFLPEWKYSSHVDRVIGYKCVSGLRTRSPVPPGHWIGRHMKTESACQDSTVTVVPISNDATRYFDCATNTVKVCGQDEFFNCEACQGNSQYAFSIGPPSQQMDLFQFDNLDKDVWMKSWDYLTLPVNDTLKIHCSGNYIYNELYHICSHKDCKMYPFLSQINFFIGLQDGSTCEYDTSRRYLEKIPPVNNTTYIYWSQRMIHDAMSSDGEPCREGEHIDSGHIAFDKTIYATCDPQQPFVFCPSPLSTGIEKLNGIFTCKSTTSIGTTIIPPGEKRSFSRKELFQITSSTTTSIKINNQTKFLQANIPFDLTQFNLDVSQYTIFLETTTESITVHYQFRVSHPPNITRTYTTDGKYQGVKTGSDGSGYIMKIGKFTTKPLDFPRYTLKSLLPGMILD